MTADADKLREAMEDVQVILAALVGVPFEGLADPFKAFDPADRTYVTVDRETVPEAAWRGAIMALDILSVTIGLTDPDAPPVAETSFEESLRIFMHGEASDAT